MEAGVEAADFVLPAQLALGDFVELALDARSEVVVEDAGEVFGEEAVDDDADVGGDELALLGTEGLAARRAGDFLAGEGEG